MRDFYKKMKCILDKIDFDAIYPGFHIFPFALYTEETAWLEDREIDRPDGFFGNTATEFEGRQIAIWNVDFDTKTADLEWFAADMVHEMFHAYQREAGLITEIPEELKMLQYPDNLTNYTMKHQENVMLADAIKASKEEKRRLYKTVAASRALRKSLIGDFVHQEELLEKLEGMAEFSGCLALKQLNEEKYAKRIEGCGDCLKDESNTFNIRRNSYYSGTVLRYLEMECKEFDTSLERLFEEHQKDKEEKIQSVLGALNTKTCVDTFICGFDPMNQVRLGDYIYASHIVFLWIDEKPTEIKCPVVLEMQPGSANMVKAYYTLK